MKGYRNSVSKRFGLVGAGIGLTLFALFGLLQGSLIGGAIGLDIVNSVFDPAVPPTLLARVAIGASMLAGVIITGVGFVVICSSAGAALGYLAGWMAEPSEAATEVKQTSGRAR